MRIAPLIHRFTLIPALLLIALTGCQEEESPVLKAAREKQEQEAAAAAAEEGKEAASEVDAEAAGPTQEELLLQVFSPPVRHPAEGIEYVGAESCKECHQQAYDDWKESHHYVAMQHVEEDTVLADFDDHTFTHFGRETRFYRDGDAFMVNTEDSDGKRKDFEISYVFGAYPLQQYLIAFPGGRQQALNICWDTRPVEEGGQRWFHLYPDEEIPPDDVLHWTRRHFNWNYMCADCHSTDLNKGYDPETNTYDTTWSEMNVSCEACHGPAGNHLTWARDFTDTGQDLENYKGDMGLVVKLSEDNPGAWTINPDTGHPVRTHPLEHQNQLHTCAPCHAHRQPLQEQIYHGQHFLDTHIPSVLDRVHYHADGQIKEEVYVYGSFIQSKMYHSDVRCTDCHHPHTYKVYTPGNELCTRCHQAPLYDTPAHHFHLPDSSGASCVECHMPEKYYMVVDGRRDHSIRVPRPDLSVEYGTPNACTVCHVEEGQDDAWAAEAFIQWWGEKEIPKPYGETLAKGRMDVQRWQDELTRLAENTQEPGIARATTLQLMKESPTPEAIQAITGRLRDPDPIVRHHAVSGLEVLPQDQKVRLGAPSLYDEIRAVRIEAARVMADSRRALRGEDAKAYGSAMNEYLEAQRAVWDVPEGQTALALFYQDIELPEKAEEAYRRAMVIDPGHVPSRINLSEMLYQSGRLSEAGPLLKEGVEISPESGFAQEAYGRYFIRQKQYEEGMTYLIRAAELQPERAELQYFVGVGLNSLGQFSEAMTYLREATNLQPQNVEYLTGTAMIARDAGELQLAIEFLDRALRVQPNSPQLMQVRQQLQFMLERE